MIGDASLFTSIVWKEKGYVKFGDNSRNKIVAIGAIGLYPHTIENVSLVKRLKHNLLSISQLSDIGYKMVFEHDKCYAYDNSNMKLYEGYRKKNIYLVKPSDVAVEKCFLTMNDCVIAWHRRLGHVNFSQLKKLFKKYSLRET